MTRTIRFTSPARGDIVQTLGWYKKQSPALRASFQEEIDRQVTRIVENPLQFPIVHADVRRARLRRFPYGLFFRIDADDIFVIACLHASRDPRRLGQRS